MGSCSKPRLVLRLYYFSPSPSSDEADKTSRTRSDLPRRQKRFVLSNTRSMIAGNSNSEIERHPSNMRMRKDLSMTRARVVIPSRLYRSVLHKNALGRVILFPRKILFRTNKYFLVSIIVLNKIKKRCY